LGIGETQLDSNAPHYHMIWAKRKQIISSLSSELALLRQKGGFRVSKAVYEYALEQAGE
jgi:hypothetical protein